MKESGIANEWGVLAEGQPLTPQQVEEKARHYLAQMTLDEKIHQMSGDKSLLMGGIQQYLAYNASPIHAGENTRLGIPGVRFSDGPRGVVMYHSTCFPVSMGRGASWDPELEERVGDAIGVEVRTQGANLFAGVCINLLRHPAWGRAQETYGEDPFHLGEMGAALVRGVQRHVMACVKHYALNSLENMRHKVDVQVDERTLHEIYLPHFKRCIEEGAAAVMSAYNKVNGVYCGHNPHLLRDILKGEWGFQGFVMSDFLWGIYDAAAAIEGGLDMEMPFSLHYRAHLKKLVKKGAVPESWIDDAVLRILRQKLRFAGVGEPGRYTKEAVCSPEHIALARQAAVRCMVLLKNDRLPGAGAPLLPLNPAQVRKLAVIGALANQPNIGDHGSSRVRPPHVVTPLEGIFDAVEPETEILYNNGKDPLSAAAAARGANAVVVVVGFTSRDEGEFESLKREGGDRRSLTLHPADETLILTVTEANPRTVVVLMGGSAVVTDNWRQQVPSILMAWYPGMEGGHALADILFGRENPSAKLPCAFPRADTQLPTFSPEATNICYDLLHGYRLMDRNGEEAAFPFGFGLSYTSFTLSNLQLEKDRLGPEDVLRASLDVTNTGDRPGSEVIQLYFGYAQSKIERSPKELKGFQRIHLLPGETKRVEIAVPVEHLSYYNAERHAWTVEAGTCRVYMGNSSAWKDLLSAEFTIESNM